MMVGGALPDFLFVALAELVYFERKCTKPEFCVVDIVLQKVMWGGWH